MIDTVVNFLPPLPCGVTDCGKPATAGVVALMPDGLYSLFPMCVDCSIAVYNLYKEVGVIEPVLIPETEKSS